MVYFTTSYEDSSFSLHLLFVDFLYGFLITHWTYIIFILNVIFFLHFTFALYLFLQKNNTFSFTISINNKSRSAKLGVAQQHCICLGRSIHLASWLYKIHVFNTKVYIHRNKSTQCRWKYFQINGQMICDCSATCLWAKHFFAWFSLYYWINSSYIKQCIHSVM